MDSKKVNEVVEAIRSGEHGPIAEGLPEGKLEEVCFAANNAHQMLKALVFAVKDIVSEHSPSVTAHTIFLGSMHALARDAFKNTTPGDSEHEALYQGGFTAAESTLDSMQADIRRKMEEGQ